MATVSGRKWKLIGAVLFGLTVVSLSVLQYAVRGNFVGTEPDTGVGGQVISKGEPGHKIAGRLYVEAHPGIAGPLVVVLHGDAPFAKPGYHYRFAAALSKQVPGVPVVALLRPGFADPFGAQSEGRRGGASGDDYTKEVALDVSNAIVALRHDFLSKQVVLVGHSGGAAIAANVAAVSPELINSLVLISCPCDVPAFRLHMARQQLSPFFLWPSDSESPLDTVNALQPMTRIFAITGEQDPITLVEYARKYTDAAVARGLTATLTVVPERGHEILNDKAVLQFTQQRVEELLSQ